METVTLSPVNGATHAKIELTSEIYGGELYEYYPLSKHIVAAPGVCGGRPTFKYTRLEATMILALLSNGETIDEIVAGYWRSKLTPEAAREAIILARNVLVHSMQLYRLEAA